MTNKVIDCVHSLARRNPCGIIFSNCNGQPLSHDDAFTGSYDNTYLPSETDDDDADYPYDNIEHGGNTAPPIWGYAPTGLYDYHNDYTLYDEPPGYNQGCSAIKEE